MILGIRHYIWNKQCPLCVIPYGIITVTYYSKDSQLVDLLDVATRNFLHLPDLPVQLQYLQRPVFRSVFVNEKIYILYVQNGKVHLMRLEMQNFTHWSSCASLSGIPCLFDIYGIGTNIYAIETSEFFHYIMKFYCYDTTCNAWRKPAQPPDRYVYNSAYTDPSAVAVDSDVLVLYPQQHCIKYSTVEDQWTSFRTSIHATIPMKNPACTCTLAGCVPSKRGCIGYMDGHLVTFMNDKNYLEVYDIQDTRWHKQTLMIPQMATFIIPKMTTLMVPHITDTYFTMVL